MASLSATHRDVCTETDCLEILSTAILEEQRHLVEEFRQISRRLSSAMGWHYLLDLPWAATHLGAERGKKVMDAGAGEGVMQWWMARHGMDVTSVDRDSRADLAWQFRIWCPVRGLRPEDLHPLPKLSLRSFLPPRRPWQWHRWPNKLGMALSQTLATAPVAENGTGTVTIYNQDLACLSDIADSTFDAIVSISALEHNRPDAVKSVVRELMRVLKPGGKLIATLGAAKDADWFHEPSKGWCYTETTLREIFDLPADCPSNYDRFDKLFQALRNCDEIRGSLASPYFRSGNNGMPWGIWDPKYQSVGVVRTKR